jgi:hypothetical protein
MTTTTTNRKCPAKGKEKQRYIGVRQKMERNIIFRHQSKKVAEDCFRMRGEDEMPHTRRELNLLVARFHKDFSFGSTHVFFAPSD